MTTTSSNRLPILAGDIRRAHADVQEAAKTAAERAIAAGHLLLEAKELVGHGEWLPWLRNHCALAERTAQLYMRLAKSGATPEAIADLGMNAAAKAIYLQMPDPFAETPEPEMAEWIAYAVWQAKEGRHPQHTTHHCEWLKRNGWASPSEWMSEVGDRLRKSWTMKPMPAEVRKSWLTYWAENCDRSSADLKEELQRICEAAPELPPAQGRRRKRSRR